MTTHNTKTSGAKKLITAIIGIALIAGAGYGLFFIFLFIQAAGGR